MTEDRVLTIREYVDQRVNDLDRRNDITRNLMYQAIQAREAEMERRLAGLNELRNEVITDRGQFVPRVAFDAAAGRMETFLDRRYYEEQHKALVEKVDSTIAAVAQLRTDISSARSRNAGLSAALGIAFTIVTMVMIIIQFATVHH